jgi:N-acetylglucosamine-6-phosphate deacetylase
MSRFYASHGVTAFRPPPDRQPWAVLKALGRYSRLLPGAGGDYSGVHLEGPYLNPKRPAHRMPA